MSRHALYWPLMQLDVGWHQGVLSFVRVPARPQIANDPDARIPEKEVHEEIASEGEHGGYLRPATAEKVRVQRSDEMGPWCVNSVNDSVTQNANLKIRSCFEKQHRSENSQHKGAKES